MEGRFSVYVNGAWIGEFDDASTAYLIGREYSGKVEIVDSLYGEVVETIN